MFIHDSDVIKVTIADTHDKRYLYNNVTVDVNGTSSTYYGYISSGSYYLPVKSAIGLFTKYDATAVSYQSPADEDSGGYNTAVIITVIVAAAVCIIGCDAIIRWRR